MKIRTLPLLVLGVCLGCAGTRGSASMGVADVAAREGFTKFAQALVAAELVETLNGPGPFTVFAPTDAAFDNLPPGQFDFLLRPESKVRLQQILMLHVVAGAHPLHEVEMLDALKTLEGRSVPFSADEKGVMFGGALVVDGDIPGGNGVLHAVDRVLLPK